ncbi:MAG: zeta toxin family protein [Acidobacteria bacterium]|nr:zeta toxin family protein [Acidobacteriota bacterium]
MARTAGKRILVIAGPNGAGKTTFATEFLPHEADCPIFVNADLIAAGLSPFRPGRVAVEAGRLVLKQIDVLGRQGRSFAFETTLSGRGHARRITQWREQGYRVKLFFLRLPTPEAAIARVAQRVAEGGHDVPEAVIRRRFHAGWRNFEETYRGLVDGWAVYDNLDDVPILLEERSHK